jgi:D-alanyl-D-alanine carboxypeptidase
MRKVLTITCALAAVLLSFTVLHTPAFARYAAIVLDADTGRVLHAANPDTRNYPASLTKMMTLYLVFDALESGQLKLKQRLPVSARAVGMSPSKLGVKRGESITVETAILALVTKSANDAAVVVAEYLGGTEAKFARLMTKKARELGMRRTSFRNASGLPNRRQLSTARDMAVLAKRLVEDFPQRYRYFSRQRYTFRGKQYKNHNSLLRTYPGTDGIKTGYIRASGFNLAASVTRDGRRLIGVVFGGRTAKSRDRHMAKLLERGFKKVSAIAAKPPVDPKKRPVIVASQTKPATTTRIKPTKTQRTKPTAAPRPQPAPSRNPSWRQTYPSLATHTVAEEWAIQVGAYRDIEPARSVLRKAIARIPKLTENTRVSISPFTAGDTLMYRARLIGLSSASAKKACKQLERRKIPCVAIASKGLTASQSEQNQTAAQRR